MMSDVTFGIHIGDSSLCIAFCKDGNSEVVANNAGERITPAVFCMQDKETIVGFPAKQGLARNSGNSVTRNKSSLLYTHTNTAETAPLRDKCYHLDNGTTIEPMQVLAYFYKKLYESGSKQVGDEKLKSVLTVPYGCDDDIINDMVAVGEKEGFDIVRVVSEPAAAALAYSIGQDNPDDNSIVVIFRVGGYSCDCTVMEVVGGMYTVISNVGRRDLGGEHFTQSLVHYFADDFKRKWNSDPRLGRRSLLKLLHASETCKHTLSTMNTASVFIESLCEGIDYSGSISRIRYDTLIATTLTQLTNVIEEALIKANVQPHSVNKVIVCGGCGKVPAVQSAVSSVVPEAELLCSINPDEVIPVGAALQAGIVSSQQQIDITTITQNIYISVNEDKAVLVFRCGTPVPSRRTMCLSVTSSKALLQVHQGSSAEDAVCLAQLRLECDDSLEVNTTMNLSSDGSLHVSATSGKHCLSVTIEAPED